MPVSAVTAIPCDNAASRGPAAPRALRLRLLTAADEPFVRSGFMALSVMSRHLRYGSPLREVDRALEWMQLLGDGTHVALGACARTGEPVGVARYVRQNDSAEVAVTVVDTWQGRGAGTLLLESLCAHAHAAGVSTLSASILVENRWALKLARRYDARRAGGNGGMVEFELSLENFQMPARHRLLHHDAMDDHEALE